MKKTILGFGDSLTFGYGVKKGVSFIDRLPFLMSQKMPHIEWASINKGVNGDTSRDALIRLKSDVLDLKPDIATILFGTNDSSLNEYQYVSPYEFSANMEKIASGIKDAGTLAVLITPPPVTDSDFFPYNTNDRIEAYSYLIYEVSEKTLCPLIDLWKFMGSFDDPYISSLLSHDGIHINEKGYSVISDFISKELSYILTRP